MITGCFCVQCQRDGKFNPVWSSFTILHCAWASGSLSCYMLFFKFRGEITKQNSLKLGVCWNIHVVLTRDDDVDNDISITSLCKQPWIWASLCVVFGAVAVKSFGTKSDFPEEVLMQLQHQAKRWNLLPDTCKASVSEHEFQRTVYLLNINVTTFPKSLVVVRAEKASRMRLQK